MINIITKMILTAFVYTWISLQSFAANFSKDDLIPQWNSFIPANTLPAGTSAIDLVAEYVKDTIFGLLVLIIIGMFLFIGVRLIIARWQPEEFGKAMKSLVYVIVGIFMVSIAWLAVRLISGLEIT